MIVSAIFLVCVVTTVVGALIAALTARIIRSVCGLAICCIGLAGLYYFRSAGPKLMLITESSNSETSSSLS